jgi:hypothetical protein
MNYKEAKKYLIRPFATSTRSHNEYLKQQEAYNLAIKTLKENEGLRLLIKWMVECGFGYDNIPEEYEKYKEEISDMDYIEGLIYIAMREVENEFNM